MAGFFQNLRLVSERNSVDDMASPASNAYATTNIEATATVATEATETIANVPSLTIQPVPQGFGAYLDGILPPDIAKGAGAFSVSMQQIKNISSIPVEKFAQVVSNLETTRGLNVNGTSVPTDTTLASQGLSLIALGNGPYGTYTMSNFLGCMSGLPYMGLNVRQFIQELETPTLYDIYKNLYLAVTWERATATIQYSYDGISTYTTTGVTLTDSGGGYGRAGAAAPIVTVNGATVTATIGTDYTDITNYGRVTALNFTPGTSGSVPTISIAYPPGGSSFDNTIVQSYIDAANAEILVIKNSQPAKAQQLITNWELSGTILSIEQRAIATGLPIGVPNSSPAYLREPTLAGYPTTQYAFVDSIPRYAMFTQPHMYSQTLEAISNLNTVGGRSIVAMLRQSRNQARLQEAGIPLDNNIENKLTTQQQAELIANGVLANSVPASLQTELGSPDPYGFYDPTTDEYYNTNNTYLGNGQAIDTGQAIEPGSFAGSRYRSLIPPELSAVYTSDVLLPSTYSIQDAIDEVIRCNCDCWDNI